MPSSRPPLKTEIVAGVTTFLTMSYVVVVNPAILAAEGTGMPFDGVLTATVLVSCLMTLLMGLYARLPFAVAPGMGLNAFFAYTLVLGRGVPWETALGMVFLSGVLFLAASLTSLRESLVRAIPESLRAAAAAGIGLFLTFIGLKNAGLVAADPATLVRPGPLGAPQLTALGALAVMAWLLRRKSPFAFLAGMAAATAAGGALGLVEAPERWLKPPDFSLFLKMDAAGALKLAFLPAILTLLFTDLFDSLSTFLGVAKAGRMLDERGEPRNLRQALVVDALATLGSGLAGTSPGTAYIESAAGIEVGGRTGRTSVVTALCFLPCLFVAPLAAAVPAFATAPVLILVGAFMFRVVRELPLERLEEAVPAFLTVALIPLTFSITQGILWGFLSHVVLYVLAGRRRELPRGMYALAGVSALLLALENL